MKTSVKTAHKELKKWNFFFRLFLSRLKPCLFLPRPTYYFFSVFCPEIVPNLLFSGGNQLFLVFPRQGKNVFSSRRLDIVVPREGEIPCCPKGLVLVIPRDNFCPEGRRVSSKSPERTKIIPRDHKDKPLGQQGISPSRGTTIPNLRDLDQCNLDYLLNYCIVSRG